MKWSRENDRKGLVGTVFIHIILFLLLLIRTIGVADEMLEEQGGVQVSFGEELSGGDDAISETADVSTTEAQEQPTSETTPTETTPTPTTDNPMVTNDQTDAPEVTPSKPAEKKPEIEKPKVDPRISGAMKKIKNAKQTGEKNTSTGPGNDNRPGGDPNADNKGPGGNSAGNNGKGVSWNLSGFGLSGFPNIKNESPEEGRMTYKICLDENGVIKYLNWEPSSTSTSLYLKKISEEAIRKSNFVALGNQTSYNCGTITIVYKQQ